MVPLQAVSFVHTALGKILTVANHIIRAELGLNV